MRIGVNALYLIPGGVGGTEIYLRNLLRSLAVVDSTNEYVIFTNRETGKDLVPAAANFRWAPQPVRARVRPWRILWEQTGLALAVRRERIDVLFNPGFTMPVLSGCPSVTVFHDLQHKRHPEYFRWFDLPFWQLLLWASARRSRALIAPSEATRADVRKFYGVDATVVHHGVEPEFFEIGRRREPKDYLLCVSTLHPHKNIERLIRAHAGMKNAPELVIAGLKGFQTREIERIAGRRVRLTGWVPREELYELYRCARGFVYPSTFEGFGMPVMEAMAAGVPVACSRIPPLVEVAGEWVEYFDASDEGEIRGALERLGSEAPLGARERAGEFTWEKAARETLGVLTLFQLPRT
ncbi:MAG: glycosyltransferase family 4 protein [Acidobacteriota bacterium]|nr:glycosyltransferase family 4 protein [Acidobacteriota bacterium]